jgi:hypothetical protein
MSYLCYFCLFTHSGVKYVLTKQVTWWVSYKRQELLTLREHLCSPSVFGGVHVAHLFSFLCCVFLFCLSSSCVLCTQCSQCLWIVFVLCLVYSMFTVSLDCLRPVSCVPNVHSVSGLSLSCVLCTQCSQCLWIVFVLCLVYPMFTVSLDCLRPVSCVPNVHSVSGLSILECFFSFL